MKGDGVAQALEAVPLAERFVASVSGLVRRAQEAPSPTVARFVDVFLAQVPMWAASKERELRRVVQRVGVLL